ncbi:PREDICTED: leucine-rich repeats and immunoglobulin-like domains protein 3 isoform X3 [Habropoda laboriosa]|uniref:leucine-rich repeats and immunoglobulin-like domains protein 3 isoform X3 n=1 Tax=Habropoda laboriosa TaxID=597456 RepID=UPI00083D1A10|nr:PREDICTED: leucine-rich repeats and immunoglobulin-like domains protein 3 isoform X3 [Habropoda laboriosa]
MSNSEQVFLVRRLVWKYKWTAVICTVLCVILSNSAKAERISHDGTKDNQCPVECACLGNVVDCSSLQLIGAPSGLPPWTEILELKENNIVNLEPDALLHLIRLKELDLSANKFGDNFTIILSEATQLQGLKINKNQLTQVPDMFFVKNITNLALAHNSISDINGTALLTLQRLENLDISGNKISVVRNGSFLSPNSLTHLNLNMNQIKIIENGSLDNLTALEELRLNKNHLTQLKDLFTNLKKLRILEINRNELQTIQGLSLRGLKNLKELRLKRNKIETLDDGAFWPLENLTILQLDFNLLTMVRKGGLFGLERLQKLTLSHNRISTIEMQAWDRCKEIVELDLSHNEISVIERDTFEFLEKLEKLKLDHNQITYIADGAFRSTPNLQILELNFNKISYMVEDINGAFDPLGQLWKLGLAHNRIKSVNKNAFTGLSSVTELDLTGNDVTSIQENAFVSMTSLTKLRMNSSTYRETNAFVILRHTYYTSLYSSCTRVGALVCDCGLQWLSMWLREHRYSDAEAYCGYPHWLQGMSLTQLHHKNFTCDEYPKPRIIEEPKSQMGIKGDNVTLICRATSTASAPLNFMWKHDNVEMEDANLQINTDSTESGVTEASSILILTNVTHANAGKYQCMVTNTYGTTYSAKAKLSILIYPSFSKIPHDIRVIAGSTARLECSAEGQPSPQIAWQKDGGNDFPAARERRMHMMPTDDVLFIVDVKTADSGVYSCTAQNLAGLIVANATLTILETPSFVKPMENKEITVGGSIVLECMASGTPRPKLSWRKNGNPLQATERHFFTAEDQLLIIVDTKVGDAGSYECEMSNSLGSVVGASHLTVKPAPTSTPSPASVNEDDILGLIIITVVCCAVGTSIVWVVIIYQTRRRLNAGAQGRNAQPSTVIAATVPDTQTHLYLETSSQHSKDSGTGDSTNPSSDQLQLCLPEEIVTCSVNNEEETGAVNVGAPLLRYTNHERHVRENEDCAV